MTAIPNVSATALVPSTPRKPKQKAKETVIVRVVQENLDLMAKFMMTMAHRMEMPCERFWATDDFRLLFYVVFPSFNVSQFDSLSKKNQTRRWQRMKCWADEHIAARLRRANVRCFSALREKEKAIAELRKEGIRAYYKETENLILSMERDFQHVAAAKGSLLPEDEVVLLNYWEHVRENPLLHEEFEAEFEWLRTALFSELAQYLYTLVDDDDLQDEYCDKYEALRKLGDTLIFKAQIRANCSKEKSALFAYLRLQWEIGSDGWFYQISLKSFPRPVLVPSLYQKTFVALSKDNGIERATDRFSAEWIPEIAMDLSTLSPAYFTGRLIQKTETETVEYRQAVQMSRPLQIDLVDDAVDQKTPDQ